MEPRINKNVKINGTSILLVNLQEGDFWENLGMHGRTTLDVKEIGVSVRSWNDSVQVKDYWRDLVNARLNLQVT